MVSQYLHGRRPLNFRAAIRFAQGLGVGLEEVSPEIAKEFKAAVKALPNIAAISLENQSEYARVRCVNLRLSLGSARYDVEPLEGVGEFIAFRHDWLDERHLNSAHLLALRVGDEGMRPTLSEGDFIVTNTQDTQPRDAQVFVLNYEGEVKVRRLIRDAGQWWLYCDNLEAARFPRKQFVDKRCFIVGRVVHRQSEVL